MATFSFTGTVAASPVPDPPWLSPYADKFEVRATDFQIKALTSNSCVMLHRTATETDSQFIETVFAASGTSSSNRGLVLSAPATVGADLSGADWYEMRVSGDTLSIRKRTGTSVADVLASVTEVYSSGRTYRFSVKHDTGTGSARLAVSINGTEVLAATTTTPLTGRRYVGIITAGSSNTRFGPTVEGGDLAVGAVEPSTNHSQSNLTEIDASANAATAITLTSADVSIVITEKAFGVFHVTHPNPFTADIVTTLTVTNEGVSASKNITIPYTQTAAVSSSDTLVYVDGSWI